MQDTLSALLAGVPAGLARDNLTKFLRPMADRLACQMVVNAAPVIFGLSSPNAKTAASVVYALVQGSLVSVAASTTLATPTSAPALAAGQYGICAWFINKAGTITAVTGAAGATVGAAKFPQTPEGSALLAFILVTNAAGFTWGTTALDGTTTTVYFGPTGAVDPTVLL